MTIFWVGRGMGRGEGVRIFFNAFQRGFFLSGMGKKLWLILRGGAEGMDQGPSKYVKVVKK